MLFTNPAEHKIFRLPPFCDSVLSAAITHFFQSLRNAVLRVNATLVMSHRNIVDVQVRRFLVKMYDRIENVKVGIPFGKSTHILAKAGGCFFSRFCAYARIFHSSELDKVFIKTLAFVGRSQLCFRNRLSELIFKIAVFDLSVTPLLLCIIEFDSFGEQLLIRRSDRLTDEHDVILRSCRVGVLGVKRPVVVTDTAFSLAN